MAAPRFLVYSESMEILTPENLPPGIDPGILDDPVFRRVLADAISIQDRFSPEPVYATTGKGYLKSEGVSELQEIKKREASKPQ